MKARTEQQTESGQKVKYVEDDQSKSKARRQDKKTRQKDGTKERTKRERVYQRKGKILESVCMLCVYV